MSEKPYKVVVPGIDGGGAQVFEADTPEEMQQQFQQAQENATAKIRELAQQNTALSEQQAKINQAVNPGAAATKSSGYDRQGFFNTLYERPDDAIISALEHRMGMKFDDFIADYNQVRGGAQLSIQNNVNAQFAQKHPELLQVSQENDLHNANVISKILTDNGWQYNINNLEAAYAVAKTNNQLKLNEANFSPEVTLPSVPTTVRHPTGTLNNQATEDEFLRTAPLAKVKEYLEKKYA